MYFYIDSIIKQLEEKYNNHPNDIYDVDSYKQGVFDAITTVQNSRSELEEKRRKVCEMANGCGLLIMNNF